jgi:predicted O-linked N-acetylglucosamine transferase (SPINDLY family)
MATTSDTFQAAFAHHQAGRLREAAALYQQILAAEPDHADALHLLGVVAHQSRQHDQAVDLIARAIALRGDRSAFHSNLGEVYRVQNKLDLAERSLRRALDLDPASPDAHNNLGIVLGAIGRSDEAIEAFQQAIRLRPTDPSPHNNLATVLQNQGRLDEAVAHYRQALELNPRYADAYGNLGAAFMAQNKLDEAIEAYGRAVELQPGNSRNHVNLGAVYHLKHQLERAIACYREALRLDPRSAPAQANLYGALADHGQFDEAVAACREALSLDPNLPSAHFTLAKVAHKRGQFAAAEESYRRAIQLNPHYVHALVGLGQLLESSGRPDEAVEPYTQALAVEPKYAAAHFYRANAYRKIARVKDAVAGYRAALSLEPRYPEAYNALAVAHEMLGYPDEAIACCLKGLEQFPQSSHLHANLSEALAQLGRHDEALAAARKAVELGPDSPLEHSNLLYLLNFMSDRRPEDVFAEHQEWARRHAEPLTAEAGPHDNDRSPERRLRVGYVSDHFRDHAVNFFSEPLIAAHDKSRFEIFCYSDVARPDEVTRRIEAAADHWRPIRSQSDAQLAELVRADRIDILVDLAGHIAGNRLLAFARKPAPVQVTYIGYQNTTGMSAMDYRLTDALADPPGETDRYYTEKLVRLPDAFFCYRPADEAPGITPLPARERGSITFGSFNNFKKVTEAAIGAWMEILARVPDSRLLVLAHRGGYVERHLREAAQARALDPARIEVYDKQPRRAYFELVQQADIALDPFPFNGHTTTCDAIWLGIPVVMLAGKTYASRFGASVLANVGLGDLIADSHERYVALAVNLAGDLDRLNKLRHGLRQQMARSVLLDFGGFARKVEAAYREMWRTWCAAQAGSGEPG